MSKYYAWKADERKVAKKVGGKRVALSGGPGAPSRADVLTNHFFIEVKRRERFGGAQWLEDALAKGLREERTGVVVVHVAHSQQWVVLMDLDDFQWLASRAGVLDE